MNYEITHTTLQAISKFFEYHGRIYTAFQWMDEAWIKEVENTNRAISAFSVVSNNKSKLGIITKVSHSEEVAQQVEEEYKEEYLSYLKLIEEIKKSFVERESIDTKLIQALHKRIKNYQKDNFRTKDKVLPLEVWENDICEVFEYNIKTKPAEIESKLKELSIWYKENLRKINGIILAGIVHYKLAEIHPYEDGNGRLAKLLTRAVLFNHGIDTRGVLPIEYYYLENQEYYYNILDKSVKSGDLSQWLEFFAKGLFGSASLACNKIYELSGGTIDLVNMNVVSLNTSEWKVIRVLQKLNYPNGADIAKELNVSRQYVNTILQSLLEKKVVTKRGKAAGVKYSLKKI